MKLISDLWFSWLLYFFRVINVFRNKTAFRTLYRSHVDSRKRYFCFGPSSRIIIWRSLITTSEPKQVDLVTYLCKLLFICINKQNLMGNFLHNFIKNTNVDLYIFMTAQFTNSELCPNVSVILFGIKSFIYGLETECKM